jgi:HSP20 family protein
MNTTNTNTNQNHNSRQRFCKEKMEEKFRHFRESGHPFAAKLDEMFSGNQNKVNISENENAFVLQLFASGLVKSGFEVSVKDQKLKVKYSAPISESKENFLLQEFSPESFSREFQLSDKILDEQISVKYENGILQITLPKNPEKNKEATVIRMEN